MDSDPDRDDLERLRTRQADADGDATRDPGEATAGAACVVAKVTGTPVAGGYCTLTVQDVTGPEVEGGAGTLAAAAAGSIVALNLGSAVPAVGTAVVCTAVSYRWVFRHDG